MKVVELLCKCYNCDYSRTVVTIRDNNGGRFQNVRDFKLGPMKK